MKQTVHTHFQDRETCTCYVPAMKREKKNHSHKTEYT